MKTARLTLLTTPEFEAFHGAEAACSGITVAEPVRSRCEQRPSDEEAVLASLAGELRRAVREAGAALQSGLAEADAVLAELRGHAAVRAVVAPARESCSARAVRVLMHAIWTAYDQCPHVERFDPVIAV